jgi:antimicrobial peptide system SdpB family protein
MLSGLDRIGAFGQRWARATSPWTNVYGLARSMLAASTALTLAFNRTTSLFSPASGGLKAPFCDGLRGAGLFCVVPEPGLDLARWVAAALLVLVASGYRPRLTGIIHWWVSFSLAINAVTVDGGDGAAAVLALLLLPVTLTDGRRWHWQPPPTARETTGDDVRRIVALVALTAIRVQVAGIYFHAAVGKFSVEEWTNGTALYYWLNSPLFGAVGIFSRILQPILLSAVGVTLLTWSVLVLEYCLSAALFMPKKLRGLFLWLGIGLHAAILLIHGLVSFSTVMFAALILYLRPVERPFALEALARRFVSPVPLPEGSRLARVSLRLTR